MQTNQSIKARILCDVHASQQPGFEAICNTLSSEIQTIAPLILRFGQALFASDSAQHTPLQSQPASQHLSRPDTAVITQPSPLVRDPLDMFSVAEISNLSPEQCLDYFPLLSDVALEQTDENHPVKPIGDFMEQIWATSMNHSMAP
jgi:hypothetical protein